MPRKAQIQFRRDTAANWTAANPTLLDGELGFETDTGKAKIGDGTTAWTSLAYAAVPISAFAATLLDDTSAAAMRTTLGVTAGLTAGQTLALTRGVFLP